MTEEIILRDIQDTHQSVQISACLIMQIIYLQKKVGLVLNPNPNPTHLS